MQERHGPADAEELAQMLADSVISYDTPVWSKVAIVIGLVLVLVGECSCGRREGLTESGACAGACAKEVLTPCVWCVMCWIPFSVLLICRQLASGSRRSRSLLCATGQRSSCLRRRLVRHTTPPHHSLPAN